ncbi:MAG: ArsB/NhaD family transporter [Syntrophomonadaceae bacterium]|mgnify:CR=1 FL=1|nr:ArsB/NhaD family transporter [Syntrophomonadaceae bacterium]
MFYWISIILFVAAYALIIADKIHRTIVIWVAAALALILGVITQEQAVQEAIDFNTLWLLIGMMVIVSITRKSGVFEYLAIKAARTSGGKPIYILVAMVFVTAVLSALLDNVTTVLLIVPVTIAITDRLDINPMPFFISEILASNVGGTATLIGDPPNIMIGSATGLGFMDFLLNLSLPAFIILIVTTACLVVIYRGDMQVAPEKQQNIMGLNPVDYIKEWAILKKSLLVLGLTILGFVLHQYLHVESATIALLGAGLLLLLVGEDPEEALLHVEWPTIFFFGGLFVLVGGLVANGVIEDMARWTLGVAGNSPIKTGLLVLWVSAIGSAFVDNIPFVATMIPLLQTVGELTHMPMESIWWALALGSCLGGNGTIIGASANVIVAGMAERYGYHIGFIDYFKIGFPLMILSIVMSTVYLYLFYWM